jgi:NAD(P)-dependent dehydrogenase (short-subunit alcohol dehydrogenase family)
MAGVDGRIAVVTGAGQGLGRSYAVALAAAGAKVVVNDIGQGEINTAQQVVDEIIAAGGQAIADRNSVATPEGGQAIVQSALDAYGRIDILVSNAGIERNQSYAKSTDEQWRAVMDVHLNGTHYLCRAAWPHMIAQGHGRIIPITSPSGLWGNFSQSSYAAAKMGMIGLANVLTIEGRRYGILTNCLAPIATTPMSASLLSPALAERLAPEHVAPVVVKLASDELDTCGAILIAGGGWVSSAHIALTPGVKLDHVATPDDLDAAWSTILDAETATVGGTLDPATLEKMFAS